MSEDAVPPGGNEPAKVAGPPGVGDANSISFEEAGPFDGNPSGNGGEECEGGPSKSEGGSDVVSTPLRTTGTTASRRELYISRSTGMAKARLKTERIRRI